MRVLDLPVALRRLADLLNFGNVQTAYPEELAQRGVVGLAGLALDVFLCVSVLDVTEAGEDYMVRTKSLVNQKRKHPSMRPRSSSESPILMNVSGRSR